MSQPVKLSDGLVLDARIAGEAQERSIAGQVEFWAKLGRFMELLLDGRQVLTLCRNASVQPLSEALASVDTRAGRKRVEDLLENGPYPHFKQHPDHAGLLVRTDKNGEQTVGRFVNRLFTTVEAGASLPVPLSNRKRLAAKLVHTRIDAKSARQAKKRKACA
ncbi:MAG: hypothetical protein ABSF70_09275 [Terracidiphilus sp.]|jgi:hypothetical protein